MCQHDSLCDPGQDFTYFYLFQVSACWDVQVLTQLSENCWISRAFWEGQCSSKRDSRESRRVFEPARPHWTHISDTTGVETSGLCYLGPTVSQWNKRHIRHDFFWDPLNTVGYCGILWDTGRLPTRGFASTTSAQRIRRPTLRHGAAVSGFPVPNPVDAGTNRCRIA